MLAAVLEPNQNVGVNATPVFVLELPALVGPWKELWRTFKSSCARWSERAKERLEVKTQQASLCYCKNQLRKWERLGAKAEKRMALLLGNLGIH